jgi:hypothetical protein
MFAKLSKNFEQALKAYEEVSRDIEHKQQSAVDRSSRSSAAGGRKPKRAAPNRNGGAAAAAERDLEAGTGASASSNDPTEGLLQPRNAQQSQAQAQEEDIMFEPYDVEQLEHRRAEIAALERDVRVCVVLCCAAVQEMM